VPDSREHADDRKPRNFFLQARAALFDLDGVIVFTDKYHYFAWKKVCDESGYCFDESVIHEYRLQKLVTFMIMGETSGIAASLALERQSAVQCIAPLRLQTALREASQIGVDYVPRWFNQRFEAWW
jgi:phosphoglycolate phosphatase-like HAD superfamily hydrolase